MPKKLFLIIIIFALSAGCFADTFTRRQTGQILHGYVIQKNIGNKTIVRTTEEGIQQLILSDYNIEQNHLGRQNKVILLPIKKPIQCNAETESIEKTIIDASNKGPLLIILELDCSGGNLFAIKPICETIAKTENCPVIAFVSGENSKGVFSASIMLALACDKIYMTPVASIGAAAASQSKDNYDLRARFGQTIGEKFTSAYRGYVAALAQQKKRPKLLAMAMVDKEIEVLGVLENGKVSYIEPVNKKPGQTTQKKWSKNGTLLTLSTDNAVKGKITGSKVASRTERLKQLNAADAEIVIENKHLKIGKDFGIAVKKLKQTMEKIEQLKKDIPRTRQKRQKTALLSQLIRAFKQAIDICQRYPDVGIDVNTLKFGLNEARGQYRRIKTEN